MILAGGNANSFTVKAAETTALARDANATAEDSQRQPAGAESVSTADFWWWPAPNADGGASQQHQQISSSSSQQQQQQQQQQLFLQQQQMQDCGDDFDAFDLSLLINGTAGDGYFGDAECGRVPSAAFSATVTVRTSTTTTGDDRDYHASSTPAQQQLDMQQLVSLCEDYCFFNENTGADAKPADVFRSVTPLVTTTTCTSDRSAADASRNPAPPVAVVPRTEPATRTGSVANTTLLRSLLAADPLLPNAQASSTPIRSVATRSDVDAAVVQSTTGTAKTAETADGQDNRHRLLIEMLRSGTCHDDVVVPVARPAPRRRTRTAAFGPDDGEQFPVGGGRRRLDPTPQQADGERKRSPQRRRDEDGGRDDGQELLLYGSPYYSGTASASWLDRMVAAAAAATASVPDSGDFFDDPAPYQLQQLLLHHKDDDTKPRAGDDIDSLVDECASDLCNDYGLGGAFGQNSAAVQDGGGYYSAAAEMQAYSPPTAAQVPSVTPPPPATCNNDPSKTTTASDDGGMARQMQCWKPSAENGAAPDDYYDNLLMTVLMEAPADSCISSSTAADDGRVDDDVAVDSKPPAAALQRSSRPLENGLAAAAANTTTAANAAANTATAAVPTSSSQHIHLWQFLKELLTASTAAEDAAAIRSPSPAVALPSSTAAAAQATSATAAGRQQPMIRWLDREQGVFKIEDSQAVARLWGLRKKRPAMNYDKLSRSLRQYYKKKIMRKTERSQRLVYQFCPPYNA